MTLLADLDAAQAADLGMLDDAALTALGSKVSKGRKVLAGLAARVAGEAKRREAAGSQRPAENAADPDGDQSSQSRAKDSARGQIRDELPHSGAGAENGRAKTENADHLASRLARLSASEKARLKHHDAAIAAKMAELYPEAFRVWLDKLLVRIADRPEPDGLSAAERAAAAAAFAMFRRPGGTWGATGSFDDETGRVIDARITARARVIANRRPHGQRSITPNDRARALYELLTQTVTADAADHDVDDRVQLPIAVLVDAATLVHGPHEGTVAETWEGDPLDPRAAARMACDADLYTALYNHAGAPSRVGRLRRHATREQRLQLRGLYPTCPIDGVTAFAQCDIHHVNVMHRAGGDTELHNLVPISKRWHHRIHDAGWSLTMAPDRKLTLRRPDGTIERTIAPPTPITRHGP